jgi:hypothetical protein
MDSASTATTGFLSEFEHFNLIGQLAKQHDRIPINLHQLALAELLLLQTPEQLSSANMRQKISAYDSARQAQTTKRESIIIPEAPSVPPHLTGAI